MRERVWCPLLRVVAASLFAAYIFWNVAWLLSGSPAPSLLLGLAGLPGPTTGFTRSLFSLAHGDWQCSLRYSALAIPLSILIVVTAVWLAVKALRRQPLRLPGSFFWAWLGVLLAGWVCKLAGSPEYW